MFIKTGFGNKIYRIIQAFLKELYDWCVNYEQRTRQYINRSTLKGNINSFEELMTLYQGKLFIFS